MQKQITITIPQSLYQRVHELANRRNLPVATLLETAVSLAEAQPHDPATTALAQEEAAYRAQHPTLLANYPGQYVAIHQGQLIDHDPDELTLLHRLDATHPTQVVLMKRVEPLPQPMLRS
ncbi:MAG: hypothetical protein KC423_12235 [Anaerolineales bacterium]|nr:hypothetical protein [Anaerolineales bacterium]